jgi:RND family efflux transporter MFP subunit
VWHVRANHILLFLILASPVGVTGCDDRKAAPQSAAPSVTVAVPTERQITEWDEYTGRFEAIETVEIRARVSGYLQSVNFIDGQIVKRGDLLFVIDPRPYEAVADSTLAALNQAQARLDLANREQVRATELARTQAGSVQSLDKATQEQRAATGAVQAAEAELRRAKLDLEFTRVASPVAGRAGRHLVSVGNLISGGESSSTLLTTVVSLDPIHFYFEADQNAYLKYQRLAQSGQRPSSRDVANPVRLSLADESEFNHEGHMDFVDNQIDLGTGTIRGRAIFDNKDLIFIPGMFARLRLIAAPSHDALLLPDEAVGTDQARRFVYVVGTGNIATSREVKLGPIIDGLRVVREGLSPTDRVIVAGIQRVRAGAAVTPGPQGGANALQAVGP